MLDEYQIEWNDDRQAVNHRLRSILSSEEKKEKKNRSPQLSTIIYHVSQSAIEIETKRRGWLNEDLSETYGGD